MALLLESLVVGVLVHTHTREYAALYSQFSESTSTRTQHYSEYSEYTVHFLTSYSALAFTLHPSGRHFVQLIQSPTYCARSTLGVRITRVRISTYNRIPPSGSSIKIMSKEHNNDEKKVTVQMQWIFSPQEPQCFLSRVLGTQTRKAANRV